MKVKINKNVLFIPPYISTSWHNVSSLQMKDATTLRISLIDGDSIEIPDLPEETLNQVFVTHLAFVEQESKALEQQKESSPPFFLPPIALASIQQLPMRLAMGSLEGIGSVMQHDVAQANAPDLPKDILQKISSLLKIALSEESDGQGPEPEPHCNCPFCQVAKAIQDTSNHEDVQQKQNALPDVEVSDDELKFQQWEIIRSGEKIYTVKDRLNDKEEFTVHLGSPIGCTCGKKDCEHLIAVLQS